MDNRNAEGIVLNYPLIRKKEKRACDRISLHHRGSLYWLSFPLLEREELICGFSTRLGGVTPGAVGSLNLSFSRETNRENVIENHKRMAEALGYKTEQMVFSMQTHTTNVRIVTQSDRGTGFTMPGFTDVDGLITNESGVALMTFYADCVPLLLYDPVHHAIGCSHSGWRGTVADMGGETVRRMQAEYGTDPRDLITAIGPSICQDCYEVSEDVIEQFRHAYKEELWPGLFYRKENGKYQLNLWEACRNNFLRAGIPKDQISMPDLCTCCNPEILYSHRASKGIRGNLAAVIMLKEK